MGWVVLGRGGGVRRGRLGGAGGWLVSVVRVILR